jgi:hypothetical protein
MGTAMPKGINRTPARHGDSLLTDWKRSGIWMMQLVNTAPERKALLLRD